MKWLVIILLTLMPGAYAIAQDSEKYVTSEVGILCVRFTDIREAVKAKSSGDDAWLRSLDCVFAPADLPVTVIDRLKSIGYLDPWKVRITLPNGRGASVWGPVFAFKKFPAGDLKN